MGACFPKSPTCGEVNPNTKIFDVCCGGQEIIEHSEVDGSGEEKEPINVAFPEPITIFRCLLANHFRYS